jgi:hypothetical protein
MPDTPEGNDPEERVTEMAFLTSNTIDVSEVLIHKVWFLFEGSEMVGAGPEPILVPASSFPANIDRENISIIACFFIFIVLLGLSLVSNNDLL